MAGERQARAGLFDSHNGGILASRGFHMSRYSAWLRTCPLWQYVLTQTITSGVILAAVLVIFHGGHSVLGPVNIVFFLAWLAFMAGVYAWLGKRRNGTA
jgi:hypothetical protein